MTSAAVASPDLITTRNPAAATVTARAEISRVEGLLAGRLMWVTVLDRLEGPVLPVLGIDEDLRTWGSPRGPGSRGTGSPGRLFTMTLPLRPESNLGVRAG